MKILFVVVIVLAMSAAVSGQTADPPFPVSGTVIKLSPVIPQRDDSESRVTVLPEGTTVVVVGRQGFWYRVVFTSPQGEQTGLMEPRDLRIDPNAAILPYGRDGSGFTARGFVEAQGFGFPQPGATDTRRAIGDVLVRQEAIARAGRVLQLALGVDVRGSSYEQVEDEWRLDFEDRSVLRPRVTTRRMTASITTRHLSLDVGKQFIRWGRADILSPVDRFAPRDYVNVLDNEFLPVTGARMAVRGGGETFEFVWQPRMTPSRLPLLGQRWTIVPSEASGLTLEDRGAIFPDQPQWGARWSHVGRFDMGLSFFEGFNHLPDILVAADPENGSIALTRTYAALRSYGGEVSIPTPAFVLKAESAWFTSPTSTNDEYVLYVVEAERQAGEWLFNVGYAGEIVTTTRETSSFDAERGIARSIIGRASYTIDPRRTVTFEGAARQDGSGFYAKSEFSQTFGRHWRLTLAAAGLAGDDDDFLGQYHRNSHASATLRLSY